MHCLQAVCTLLTVTKWLQPIPVAAQSKAWAFGRALAGVMGSNPTGGGHGCLSLVSVVCCQVEVSATD
jgi:hypothetical protein